MTKEFNQETNNEIVELSDDDLSSISAGGTNIIDIAEMLKQQNDPNKMAEILKQYDQNSTWAKQSLVDKELVLDPNPNMKNAYACHTSDT